MTATAAGYQSAAINLIAPKSLFRLPLRRRIRYGFGILVAAVSEKFAAFHEKVI
jgi:hypothetical protein